MHSNKNNSLNENHGQEKNNGKDFDILTCFI